MALALMRDTTEPTEGLRAQKRRETRHRIAERGLALFAEQGYDETTLEAVAAASGVSSRTLFYYFKTKDEILQFWKGDGFMEALHRTLRRQKSDQQPIEAIRATFLEVISSYETEKSVIVDRILNSTEALRARKQAMFIEMEQAVFADLCALWPQPERRAALRMTAMMGIGTMRLAMEARRRDVSDRSLADHLRDGFSLLGLPG